MNHTAYQLNKIRRFIRTSGKTLTFTKPLLDKFREPTGQTISETIKGVFHETNSYLAKTSMESSTIRTKTSPMFLCEWADAQKIDHQYTTEYNGHQYTIGEIVNISEANVAADISLEEVQTDG